jgi:hypothetical protein
VLLIWRSIERASLSDSVKDKKIQALISVRACQKVVETHDRSKRKSSRTNDLVVQAAFN